MIKVILTSKNLAHGPIKKTLEITKELLEQKKES